MSQVKNIFLSAALVFLFSFISVSASTTNGTIDPTNGYAYGENIGWVDFGSVGGAVQVTDAGLSGYAYGENIGWINLSTVTNNAEGNLSGHAWAENVGWVDFGNVAINASGEFTGTAYGENIGHINFDIVEGAVTDWRPASVRASVEAPRSSSGGRRSSSGGGSGSKPVTPLIAPTANTSLISPSSFTRNLTLNAAGEDVRGLQRFLNAQGFTVALSGAGSTGNETTYFGTLTRQALARFQAAKGIAPAAGYFGPITRSFISNNF